MFNILLLHDYAKVNFLLSSKLQLNGGSEVNWLYNIKQLLFIKCSTDSIIEAVHTIRAKQNVS